MLSPLRRIASSHAFVKQFMPGPQDPILFYIDPAWKCSATDAEHVKVPRGTPSRSLLFFYGRTMKLIAIFLAAARNPITMHKPQKH
jgi:hypothetical protein